MGQHSLRQPPGCGSAWESLSQPWRAGLGSSAGSWGNRLLYSSPWSLRGLFECLKSQHGSCFSFWSAKNLLETGLLSVMSSRWNDIDSVFGQVEKLAVGLQCLSYCLGKTVHQNKLLSSSAEMRPASSQTSRIRCQYSLLDGMKNQRISVTNSLHSKWLFLF